MIDRLKALVLVVAIFVSSLLLWIVTPLVGLWLVSMLSNDGLVVVFAAVGVVCPLLMLGFGLLLARLNGAYLRLVGANPSRATPAWRSSLSGGRVRARQPRAVLEVSLTVSVIVATALLMIFFLFFAHSPLPAPPAP
jgi:hypothetical protein